MISLIYSKLLVTLSMLMFMVLAILKAIKNRDSIKGILTSKAYIGLLFVFLAIVVSGINSYNIEEWLVQLKMKLPFLFLPISFYIFGKIDRKTHFWIHAAFMAILVVSSFSVFSNYFQNSDSINKAFYKGKSMPLPIDHIHYAIMIAYAVTVSLLFSLSAKITTHKAIIFVIGAYLFLFVHFIAVRSGIVLSYIGIATVMIHYLYKYGTIKQGLFTLAIMLLFPFVAYKTVPSLNHKIGYMLYDIEQYANDRGNNFSDSERLMSYEIAIDLIKEKPLMGHGIGDLREIMIAKHQQKYGDKQKYINPHNQYLYIIVSIGFIGGILFFYGLLAPMIYLRKKNVFLVSLYILLMVSFLVENTIQRAVITAFFLFFILLNMGLEKKTISINKD